MNILIIYHKGRGIHPSLMMHNLGIVLVVNKGVKVKGYFPEDLIVRCIPKEESDFRFMVHERPFQYVTTDGEWIRIPIGFKTDFASVPRFFQRLIPKTGRYQEAAVVHDYLCYQWKKGKYNRKRADKIFLEMMKVLGVKGFKSKLMFWGVSSYTKALELKLIKLSKGKY